MIYYDYSYPGQTLWFFARLVRLDQPNTLFIWNGNELRVNYPDYIPSWAEKQATPKQLHDLMYHIWNAPSIKTS
jgi:hypothetical protein